MKIQTESLENHQVKLTVETDPIQFEDAKQRAARKLARKSKIPGFRPGKAPYAMVLRHLGEHQIIDEALDIYIQEIYPLAIEEAKIDPYGPGELNNVTNFNPPTFEFTIPLKPIVLLGKYQDLQIPYETQTITDGDIKELLHNLQERQAVLEPAERKSKVGDVIYIRISGKQANSENSVLSERSAPILILPKEHQDDNEWPFPGFSRKLIGLIKGETKNIAYNFPKDFYVQEMRGEKILYSIEVEEIKARILPKLDDNFAQSLGEYSDLNALKAAIQRELEQEKISSYNQDYNDKVIEAIVSISTIKYPPQILERERTNLLDQMKERLAKQNQDIDLYLKSRKMTNEDLLNELNPVAESRLKKSLVLFELAEAEGIQIEKDELQAETNKTLEEITPLLQKSKVTKKTEQELMSTVMSNVMMDLMVKRTLEKIRDIVNNPKNNENIATPENSPIAQKEVELSAPNE